MTSVRPWPASPDQSWSVRSLHWPATKLTALASSRWVGGGPGCAAHPRGAGAGHPLVCGRSVAATRVGQAWWNNGGDPLVGDCGGGREAHIDDERAAMAGGPRPVLVGQILALARDEADRARIIAVGEGEPGLRRAPRGGGDAGDDFAGHAGFARGLELFAAAAEDEGVAAFQPHDLLARERLSDAQIGRAHV